MVYLYPIKFQTSEPIQARNYRHSEGGGGKGQMIKGKMCIILKHSNNSKTYQFRIFWGEFFIWGHSFQSGENLLNMICLMLNFYTKSDICPFWYNFDKVLCQFLETGTSDRYLIGIIQHLRFSGFILYPIFSFFLYSPINQLLGSLICRSKICTNPIPLMLVYISTLNFRLFGSSILFRKSHRNIDLLTPS